MSSVVIERGLGSPITSRPVRGGEPMAKGKSMRKEKKKPKKSK